MLLYYIHLSNFFPLSNFSSDFFLIFIFSFFIYKNMTSNSLKRPERRKNPTAKEVTSSGSKITGPTEKRRRTTAEEVTSSGSKITGPTEKRRRTTAEEVTSSGSKNTGLSEKRSTEEGIYLNV
jgi:hypothetical protein